MTLGRVADFYDEPGMAWSLRAVGPHLHPGSEESTVELARRAAAFGFVRRGYVIDLASALGAPSRFIARRFASTVLCVDMDRRMHAAAAAVTATEGLTLAVQPLLARTEALPLRTSSCDGAWSQDALCHMDKQVVLAEVARVLRPGALIAFTDFIARQGLTDDDRATLRRDWAFPSLFTLARYVAVLDDAGFEVLLAEDRTDATMRSRAEGLPDDDAWWRGFAARWGEQEASRRLAIGRSWQSLIERGRAGYGMLIARRRG